VGDCYAFLDLSDSSPLNSSQRNRFLSHMAKTYEDGQVKQADSALRLYPTLFVFFLIEQSRYGISAVLQSVRRRQVKNTLFLGDRRRPAERIE